MRGICNANIALSRAPACQDAEYVAAGAPRCPHVRAAFTCDGQ